MSHRGYSLSLAGLFLGALLAFSLLSVYLQPLVGDLTRVGWRAERDFGWNEPQRRYREPLYDVGRYTRPYDVIVIGDSFSRGDPAVQWQNYFVEQTGVSLLTLDTHIDDFHVEMLMDNPFFRRKPPKLVVIQTAERELLITHGRDTSACPPPDWAPGRGPKFTAAPAPPAATETFVRGNEVLTALNPGYGKMFVIKRAQEGFSPGPRRAYQFTLTEAPFSSASGNELLVYYKDLLKEEWTEAQLQRIRCRLRALRQAVDGVAETRLVVFIAPDKLTAYREYVAGGRAVPRNRIGDILGHDGIEGPRLDKELGRLIEKGELDVYLPNDTHWGWRGHAAAASALAAFLADR